MMFNYIHFENTGDSCILIGQFTTAVIIDYEQSLFFPLEFIAKTLLTLARGILGSELITLFQITNYNAETTETAKIISNVN